MPRQGEWETHVSQFQDTSAEAKPAGKWQLMERIYKMDEYSRANEGSSLFYKNSCGSHCEPLDLHGLRSNRND